MTSPQGKAREMAGRQCVEQAGAESDCPNCARLQEELQESKVWDEFFEFEVANAEDESDLVKSTLTDVG